MSTPDWQVDPKHVEAVRAYLRGCFAGGVEVLCDPADPVQRFRVVEKRNRYEVVIHRRVLEALDTPEALTELLTVRQVARRLRRLGPGSEVTLPSLAELQEG